MELLRKVVRIGLAFVTAIPGLAMIAGTVLGAINRRPGLTNLKLILSFACSAALVGIGVSCFLKRRLLACALFFVVMIWPLFSPGGWQAVVAWEVANLLFLGAVWWACGGANPDAVAS